jgi:hypothetical protein
MIDVNPILFLEPEYQNEKIKNALPTWRKIRDKEVKRFIFHL